MPQMPDEVEQFLERHVTLKPQYVLFPGEAKKLMQWLAWRSTSRHPLVPDINVIVECLHWITRDVSSTPGIHEVQLQLPIRVILALFHVIHGGYLGPGLGALLGSLLEPRTCLDRLRPITGKPAVPILTLGRRIRRLDHHLLLTLETELLLRISMVQVLGTDGALLLRLLG